jgi:hypothetical protein
MVKDLDLHVPKMIKYVFTYKPDSGGYNGSLSNVTRTNTSLRYCDLQVEFETLLATSWHTCPLFQIEIPSTLNWMLNLFLREDCID